MYVYDLPACECLIVTLLDAINIYKKFIFTEHYWLPQLLLTCATSEVGESTCALVFLDLGGTPVFLGIWLLFMPNLFFFMLINTRKYTQAPVYTG